MLQECVSFRNVRLVLYELNNDYLKCLQLFLETNEKTFKGHAISLRGRLDAFLWLQEKHALLEQLASEPRGEIPR